MNMPRKNRRVMLAVLLSSGVIGAACPSVAFAEALQGASSPSDTPPAEVAGSESTEIVVTAQRSEEHPSELQSLMRISYAVFCLKTKIHNPLQEHVTINKLSRKSSSYS